MIESAHFCTGAVGSISICSNCSIHCLNCTSFTSCSLCENLYKWDSTNVNCVPNCSYVTNCVSCIVGTTNVECTNCLSGYRVASTLCESICGDGLIVGI